MGRAAEMPETALIVGEFGRQGAAVHEHDATRRIAGVVLVHRRDQRRANVGRAAVHDDREIVIDHLLQHDQRLGGLAFVVIGHQFQLLAKHAAAGVHLVDGELDRLNALIPHLGESPR